MKRKKVDAVLVSPNNKLVILLFLSLTFLSNIATSEVPTHAENLRKSIFGIYAHKTACKPMKYRINEGISGVKSNVNDFIKEIVSGVKSGKISSQLALFHPRLKVSSEAIDKIIASEKMTIGFPMEVSVLKVWALNTVDGSPGALFCSEDEIKVWPQYSYPLQFGVWFQMLGEKELGRIYATIVPSKGRWYIGAFRYQQWTHKSKDYEKWFNEGQKDLEDGFKEAAFVKFDIAAKLIDGKKEFYLPVMEQIKNYQKNVISKEFFSASIKKSLKEWNVVYLSTILGTDGSGIVVRVQKEKEISGKAIVEDCKKIVSTLNKEKWFKKVDGIKCGYTLKGEPIDKDGFMGGVYISKVSL